MSGNPNLGGFMKRHYVQSPESPRQRAFAAKRARYAELRQAGVSAWDACMEIGVDPFQGRYERWYEYEQRQR